MAQPKKLREKPVRWKRSYGRRWIFDFRGIKNRPPKNKRKLKKELSRPNVRSYAGNKPFFTSPEQLQIEIDQYFESCFGPLVNRKTGELVRDNNGNIVQVQVEPFTVTGLAYWIGVPTETLDQITWGSFDDLGEKDEEKLYSAILKRAKQKIALYAEQRLYDKEGFNGAKFVLDHHFRMVTRREEAEIAALEKTAKYKEEELKLKKQMLEVDDEEDGILQVTIVRKED